MWLCSSKGVLYSGSTSTESSMYLSLDVKSTSGLKRRYGYMLRALAILVACRSFFDAFTIASRLATSAEAVWSLVVISDVPDPAASALGARCLEAAAEARTAKVVTKASTRLVDAVDLPVVAVPTALALLAVGIESIEPALRTEVVAARATTKELSAVTESVAQELGRDAIGQKSLKLLAKGVEVALSLLAEKERSEPLGHLAAVLLLDQLLNPLGKLEVLATTEAVVVHAKKVWVLETIAATEATEALGLEGVELVAKAVAAAEAVVVSEELLALFALLGLLSLLGLLGLFSASVQSWLWQVLSV